MYRKCLMCFLAMFFITSSGYAKENSDQEYKVKSKKEINRVNNQNVFVNSYFKKIDDNLAAYYKVEADFEGGSTEGGHLVGYCNGDELVKITAEFLGETGKNITSYYMEKGELIYVIDEKSTYDKPMYMEGSKISKVSQKHYQIRDNKIIKVLNDKGLELRSTQKELNKSMGFFLQDIKDFTPMIKCGEKNRT